MKRFALLAILVAVPLLSARPSAAEADDVKFAEPPPGDAPAAGADAEVAARATLTATPSEARGAALVRRMLLEPLAAKDEESSKFSRARMPARERRVRVTDAGPVRDDRGRRFVRFVVDERRGIVLDAPWELGVIVGCAYLERGEVFVQKGEEYRPAALLLGKYKKAGPASTCHPRGEPVAHARR